MPIIWFFIDDGYGPYSAAEKILPLTHRKYRSDKSTDFL